MHIRNRFDTTRDEDPTKSWRAMLIEQLPEYLHEKIKGMEE
jgi:hypothetical protein